MSMKLAVSGILISTGRVIPCKTLYPCYDSNFVCPSQLRINSRSCCRVVSGQGLEVVTVIRDLPPAFRNCKCCEQSGHVGPRKRKDHVACNYWNGTVEGPRDCSATFRLRTKRGFTFNKCSGDHSNSRLWCKTSIPGFTALSVFNHGCLVRELSTSTVSLQYDLRKVERSPSGSRKFYFDTHAVVCLLEENGFTTPQAEVIVAALVKIMNSSMELIYKDMVTKVQQEIMLQQVMSQIASVKKEMIILEKSEFTALRTENEKVKIELQQLKIHLTDEMNKIRSDIKLDMNLEKSRIKEMYAEHERKLLETRSEIVELNAHQDRAVTQTNRKIDTEVAGLKTMLESHKLDTIKYLAGSVFTGLTITLGFYRLWM
ncbi:UNVERIFIED_CONTAM: hypothetical protein FKN15_065150 [Acipenser sinensis]